MGSIAEWKKRMSELGIEIIQSEQQKEKILKRKRRGGGGGRRMDRVLWKSPALMSQSSRREEKL